MGRQRRNPALWVTLFLVIVLGLTACAHQNKSVSIDKCRSQCVGNQGARHAAEIGNTLVCSCYNKKTTTAFSIPW